jgi:hypothetical protein
MRDVGDDPQEMAQMLIHVCDVAVAAGVNPGSMLTPVGAISSGPMRELIVEARCRHGSAAA